MNEDMSFPDFSGSFTGTKYVLDPVTREGTSADVETQRLAVHDIYMSNLKELTELQAGEVDEEKEERESRNDQPLEEGEEVVVVDLKTNKQLNGLEGVVTGVVPISKDRESREYVVELSNGFRGKFSESNLERFDEDPPRFLKLYRGGLLVNAPLVIEAGEEVDCSVYWCIPGQQVIYF